MNSSAKYLYLKPQHCGWLRRSEFDEIGTEVWERPDGKLFYHMRSGGQLLVAKLKPQEEA